MMALPHWDVFFPSECFSDKHDMLPLVTRFQSYFADLKLSAPQRSKRVIPVDYADLRRECPEVDVDDALKLKPAAFLAALGLAATLTLAQDPARPELSQPRTVRIYGHDTITTLKDLKANLMGRFISIRGTVVRVSSIKPIVTRMAFACGSCGEETMCDLVDGKFSTPVKCHTAGCRAKTFHPSRGSRNTLAVDWQRIRVQEKLADDQVDSGRIPRTIECEICEDLVDLAVPGDVVSVSGIVKVFGTDEGKGKKGTQMYYLYLSANSLVKAAGDTPVENHISSGDSSIKKDMVLYTKKDLIYIKQILNERDVFKLLVNSLCPAIFGHELVKAGLILALFGGSSRTATENRQVTIRSNPHILVVGDPGLGKSQMLAATVKAASRGVYVCGNTTTTSGLTVTVCKDSETGDTALEAGALVLGDRGICCIDEFDKITEHQALLEAMEQQSVSIAKAGIVCNLPARTTVIAAANPVGGHYNKGKTVSENLKMNTALLSRFDLVFILLDKPDEDMDMFLSEHIISLHSGSRNKRLKNDWGGSTAVGRDGDLDETLSETSLRERLRCRSANEIDPLPLPLLRKYIAYAREHANPCLSNEAAVVLRDFYLTLRRNHRSADGTPITTRQLESMIRLSEARAKCEMRTTVTLEDAEDVIALMKYSLWETYKDNTGQVDFQRSQMGAGSSKQKEPKRFIAHLSRIAKETGSTKFNYDQLVAIAKDIQINHDSMRDFIDSLNQQGYLLKKNNRLYALALVE